MVKRAYVEKKPGFDIEAKQLYNAIKENLRIDSIKGVRVLHCYDVDGLTQEDFEISCQNIFSEPAVDFVYYSLAEDFEDFIFGKRLLPGQFDQRADSAAQCIQIMTGRLPIVCYTKIYIIEGQLTDIEKAAILKHCINPVDSMQAGLDMPDSLEMQLTKPDDIADVCIIDKSDEQVAKIHNEMGLAMNVADLIFVRDYFRDDKKREPSTTEIAVIDTYWSDHCRHTTFNTTINKVEFEQGKYSKLFEGTFEDYKKEHEGLYEKDTRPITFMDIATIGMKVMRKKGLLNDLDASEEVNAASIVITVDVDGVDEEWLLMFKNETHNHPTEMEPFGGAATCLGGAIRDPLSGRSYVYQAMRVTGAGDPRVPIEDTLPGKLPQRVITTTAADGYSSYGNQIGLATGLVAELYHEGYVAKRMEVGAVIGAAKRSNVIRKRPLSGDIVVLVGGRTGRDGIGGATGSSKELEEGSLLTCGAQVQKGNAITERKLQRLFRNPAAARLILRCNDFGAGGVCVAIGELADAIEINLDAILKKYDGLDGTELAISESQERMAVVLSPDDVDKFIALAAKENLEAYEVAKITDTGCLVMKWRGEEIVNISREFLDTAGIRQSADVMVAAPCGDVQNVPRGTFFEVDGNAAGESDDNATGESAGDATDDAINNVNEVSKDAWLENLAQLNVASQKGLVEMFDSTVGAGSVLAPFGGRYQLSPCQVMAAKIPVFGETNTASVMTFGFEPYISEFSPYHGAVYAVLESVSRMVASGVDYRTVRLSFQEYFERLKDAKSWGKPFAALLGAYAAQMALGVPAIGGKDSMSGSFGDMHVPPTLISFAVSTLKVEQIISPEFKGAGNCIALIKTPYDDNDLPDFDALRKNYELLHGLISKKIVVSACAVGVGGIAAAISKMSFGNKIGVEVNYDGDYFARNVSFAQNMGLFVLELEEGFEPDGIEVIGKTTDSGVLSVNGCEIAVEDCIRAWSEPLEDVFSTKVKVVAQGESQRQGQVQEQRQGQEQEQVNGENTGFAPPLFRADNVLVAKNKVARPRVFLPVFPGSNCEWDMARQFEIAGADVDIFVINNLNLDALEESVKKMAQMIGKSQIIALPGGFSAGDEPEGSGKFISAIFRNELVADAVHGLLDDREGLVIGICNGFQALIKTGLLPYGKILPMSEDAPTLTYNAIGRHVSGLVNTKIVSDKSPWLSGVNVGDVHRVAASHGQGRFVVDDVLASWLIRNGQVAAVYVDDCGKVADDMPYNPNGSVFGIECITSYDGRVLGKMCHSERVGSGLYKNVPGNYEQKIFEGGVKYFR